MPPSRQERQHVRRVSRLALPGALEWVGLACKQPSTNVQILFRGCPLGAVQARRRTAVVKSVRYQVSRARER
eukprot:scaffold264494_cov27-Tisochrysis_lutea.AAC.9